MLKKLLFVWFVALALHLTGCSQVTGSDMYAIKVPMDTVNVAKNDSANGPINAQGYGAGGSGSVDGATGDGHGGPQPSNTPGTGEGDDDSQHQCQHHQDEAADNDSRLACAAYFKVKPEEIFFVGPHQSGDIPANSVVAMKAVSNEQLTKTLSGVALKGLCIRENARASVKVILDTAVGGVLVGLYGDSPSFSLSLTANGKLTGPYQVAEFGHAPKVEEASGQPCPTVLVNHANSGQIVCH